MSASSSGCSKLASAHSPTSTCEPSFESNLISVPLYAFVHKYPSVSTGIGLLDSKGLTDFLNIALPHPGHVEDGKTILDVLENCTAKHVIIPTFFDERLRPILYQDFYRRYYLEPAFPGEPLREFDLRVEDLLLTLISNPPITSNPDKGYRPEILKDKQKWSFVVLVTEDTVNFIPVIKSTEMLD